MAGEGQLVRIDGRRLRLTNLDKVLYPATGTTKGEVIDYVTRVAPAMIPQITGRPVTRKRWPEGVDAPSFFAKDLEPGAPDWVKRMPIAHSTGAKDYPLVEDRATLVYLAQVASLELHVPQWRFAPDGGRAAADRIVLDLDPGPGMGLAECAEVARLLRAILTDMGLEPYPVTSGSKGIHLYAALPGTQTSEQITIVARELARAVEADHPDLVVSQMAKAQRTGRVFIDWSQNNGSKTTIAPYSLRGREQPTVAAPRTWAELDDPDLRHLLLGEVLARVEAGEDPIAPLGFAAGARASTAGPLATYIAKRTAGATPEPVPANALGGRAAGDGLPRFVIQEHHASRLHWDFRLERDGVLVSWAVPKGVPESPDRNHLAVMTEDHPLEYAAFEGEIPRGEYGGGTVTIWDEGVYDLEKWRDDEIILTVHGRPGGPLGDVRLALIRTDGAGEKSTWLMHRMKPTAAGGAVAAARPPHAGAPSGASKSPTLLIRHVSSGSHHTSAHRPTADATAHRPPADADRVSGKSPGGNQTDDPLGEGVSEGSPGDRVSGKSHDELTGAVEGGAGPKHTAPGHRVSGNSHDESRGQRKSRGSGEDDDGLARTTARHDDDLRPMLATASTAARAKEAAGRWNGGGAWAELKWDGIRSLGAWDGTTLHLRGRNGTDITARYPELTEAAAAAFGPTPVVVDGEIVALDETGRPSFSLLQNRMHLTGSRDIAREAARTPTAWYLFDVLAHDGRDVTTLPLRDRRRLLDTLPTAPPRIDVPPVLDDVDTALATARRHRLEGLVVKDPASTYRRGQRSEHWLKVKITHTQEVVIGAIRPGKGGRTGSIGSLLLGIPGPDGLQYVGRVGSGFSDRTLARLDETLTPLRTDADPFVGIPRADASDALWVRPVTVAEVEYAEFTPGGTLRHARWRGLRPDKTPDEVTREE
ncbi:non-homologous end-joining DNA ligase [Microbacterium sp. zg.Y1090]|uniref:non-homologous end-joining DNA ligase n=1 Tax=Microbacterium wangruii TaxID=3049073 RepID=UPI00214C1B18|nr:MULTISPECIES: non-homologous end-joining DNA ligase [unclassified Microbacterium]MCR2818538.1 non-homologous end-joining DNA ligase [Microbacterium sp. zg.Y1090]WIM29544.1 non-homologous end-joining DNA ligase [Microbacterium sp. zg-Y1090]